MEIDSITKEELEAISACASRAKDTKQEAEFFAMKAENKTLEAQVASLIYKNAALSLYIKYGLSKEDEIDDKTGKILRGVRKQNDNEEDNKVKEGQGSGND